MSTIKDLQEALPFFVGLQPIPKVILSAILVGIALFILVLIWTPPPAPADTAVKDILERCYKRALFTRMHAQLDHAAMYASIDQCREVVQARVPSIRSKESRAAAVELLSILEAIGKFGTKSAEFGDAEKINSLKLAALGQFRKLASNVGAEYVLPAPGTLGETTYFTQKEADAPPSVDELKKSVR